LVIYTKADTFNPATAVAGTSVDRILVIYTKSGKLTLLQQWQEPL